MPKRPTTPTRVSADSSGAPVGSEHHSPSPNKTTSHGEKDTIVKGKVDKAVKGEYKGERSNEAMMGGRYSGVRGDTTTIGAKNAEKQFRKGN